MTCRIILCGPFCTGKTSIIKVLAERHQIPKLIDDTTRPMRIGERPGFPYNFITEKEFHYRVSQGHYYESVTFNGYQYGISNENIFGAKRWSLDVLSSSWPNYKTIPGVIGIYLEPPPLKILIERARARGDSEEQISKRVLLLREERSEGFHYTIPPMSLEKKISIIEKIILD